MITKSETIEKFAAAMAKVQEGIGGAIKGNTNPAFKSKYADLSAVWEAWQVIGPQNGFSVMQFPGLYDSEAKSMAMDQLVLHASGQWVQSSLSIPLSKLDAQAYGSANTYARRYSLAAAVGICPEDDDGNAASQRQPDRKENVAPPFPSGPARNVTDLKAQWRAFWSEVESCEDADQLDALLAIDNSRALMRQIKEVLPDWWNGGTREGEKYDGIGERIAKLQTELAEKANAGWQENVTTAG